MPLIEVNQNRHVSASIRLDEVTAAQVDQYAAFIHASADEVVDKALQLCLLEGPRLSGVLEDATGEAGFIHVARTEGSNQWCGAAFEEACIRGRVRDQCASGEGVILPSISCQGKNGASHRTNCDTPSLRGSCQESLGIPRHCSIPSTTYSQQEFLGILRDS